MGRTALRRATVDNPRRLTPAQAGGSRPGGRWGPLTLPVAALIVMVAAVMAGAGTWYAVDQAPTARIAVARHSVPPSPVPSSPSCVGPAPRRRPLGAAVLDPPRPARPCWLRPPPGTPAPPRSRRS